MKRRHFLSGAASTAAFPAIAAGAGPSEEAALLSWLAPADRSAAGRTAVLSCTRAGMSAAEAAASWPELRERLALRHATRDPDTARAALAGIVREDFSGGNCIDVEGWRLARSEVVLTVLSTTLPS